MTVGEAIQTLENFDRDQELWFEYDAHPLEAGEIEDMKDGTICVSLWQPGEEGDDEDLDLPGREL